ncbi:MAG: hypothetical protein QXN18_07150 [Nitrososphaerota archaeon]
MIFNVRLPVDLITISLDLSHSAKYFLVEELTLEAFTLNLIDEVFRRFPNLNYGKTLKPKVRMETPAPVGGGKAN